jgi:hypothetical protein
MRIAPRILLCSMLLGLPVQAAQQGTVVRQAPVYADASLAAQRVGRIDAGAQVTLFDRKGGWQEIYSEEEGITGWVRVYQVREGDFGAGAVSENKEDSRGFLAGLATFSRKASGFFRQDSGVTSSGTATIGVRGLSEAEISSAQADFDELQKLQGFASSKKRSRRFASAGSLKASKVPHFSGSK